MAIYLIFYSKPHTRTLVWHDKNSQRVTKYLPGTMNVRLPFITRFFETFQSGFGETNLKSQENYSMKKQTSKSLCIIVGYNRSTP